MRMNIYPKDEYDMDFYSSLILEDEYLIYTPNKNELPYYKYGKGAYFSGRFERIKVKRDGRRFELNLN